jgi:hypothetical protein
VIDADDVIAGRIRTLGVTMAIDPALARKGLAGVRLVMGTLGLFAPQVLLRRVGGHPSGAYPFRMFGIRTILIGLDLLLLDGEERRRATKMAVLIHATDTVSAAAAGVQGAIPRRAAVLTTAISGCNTALAIAAARED